MWNRTQFFHVLWVFWALLNFWSKGSFARDTRICGWCGPHPINNDTSLIQTGSPIDYARGAILGGTTFFTADQGGGTKNYLVCGQMGGAKNIFPLRGGTGVILHHTGHGKFLLVNFGVDWGVSPPPGRKLLTPPNVFYCILHSAHVPLHRCLW